MKLHIYSIILGILLFGTLCIFPVISDTTGTHALTDMSGSNLTVPTDIQRIVIACQGGVAQEVAIMGNTDTIVGMSSMNSFPMFVKMFPHLKELPNPGSFDELNMETILKLKPDVVINSITAPKGKCQTD